MSLRVSAFEGGDCKVSELPSCHLNKEYFSYILLFLEDSAARRNA